MHSGSDSETLCLLLSFKGSATGYSARGYCVQVRGVDRQVKHPTDELSSTAFSSCRLSPCSRLQLLSVITMIADVQERDARDKMHVPPFKDLVDESKDGLRGSAVDQSRGPTESTVPRTPSHHHPPPLDRVLPRPCRSAESQEYLQTYDSRCRPNGLGSERGKLLQYPQPDNNPYDDHPTPQPSPRNESTRLPVSAHEQREPSSRIEIKRSPPLPMGPPRSATPLHNHPGKRLDYRQGPPRSTSRLENPDGRPLNFSRPLPTPPVPSQDQRVASRSHGQYSSDLPYRSEVSRSAERSVQHSPLTPINCSRPVHVAAQHHGSRDERTQMSSEASRRFDCSEAESFDRRAVRVPSSAQSAAERQFQISGARSQAEQQESERYKPGDGAVSERNQGDRPRYAPAYREVSTRAATHHDNRGGYSATVGDLQEPASLSRRHSDRVFQSQRHHANGVSWSEFPENEHCANILPQLPRIPVQSELQRHHLEDSRARKPVIQAVHLDHASDLRDHRIDRNAILEERARREAQLLREDSRSSRVSPPRSTPLTRSERSMPQLDVDPMRYIEADCTYSTRYVEYGPSKKRIPNGFERSCRVLEPPLPNFPSRTNGTVNFSLPSRAHPRQSFDSSTGSERQSLEPARSAPSRQHQRQEHIDSAHHVRRVSERDFTYVLDRRAPDRDYHHRVYDEGRGSRHAIPAHLSNRSHQAPGPSFHPSAPIVASQDPRSEPHRQSRMSPPTRPVKRMRAGSDTSLLVKTTRFTADDAPLPRREVLQPRQTDLRHGMEHRASAATTSQSPPK